MLVMLFRNKLQTPHNKSYGIQAIIYSRKADLVHREMRVLVSKQLLIPEKRIWYTVKWEFWYPGNYWFQKSGSGTPSNESSGIQVIIDSRKADLVHPQMRVLVSSQLLIPEKRIWYILKWEFWYPDNYWFQKSGSGTPSHESSGIKAIIDSRKADLVYRPTRILISRQ